MFSDGLIDVVDIYINNRDVGRSRVSNEADFVNVRCRIIENSKVIFSGMVELTDGTIIEDKAANLRYEVLKDSQRQRRKIGRGFSTKIHHVSYRIEKKDSKSKWGQ